MDFSHMKLSNYLTEGISSSNNLATNAELKTAEAASGVGRQKQHSPASRESQLKQKAAKSGFTSMSNKIDVTPTPAQPVESFVNTRRAIEYRKMWEAQKSDWRRDINEAVNADDDPAHPYVEVMPHYKYKEKEAQKNALKQVAKGKIKGEPEIKKGVNEEVLDEAKTNKKRAPHPKEPKKGQDRNITLETVYSSRIKNKVRKKAKELKKADTESRKAATKAFKSDVKEKAAYKKGDQAKGRKYRKERLKHSNEARKLRGKAMRYIPIGSKEYSKGSDPTRLKSKFNAHLKSSTGRQRIALSTEAVDPLEYHKALDKDSAFHQAMAKGYAKNQAKQKKNKKVKEQVTVEDFINFLDENQYGGDPQKLLAKKVTGKAIPAGGGVRNYDNTATPKENVARRNYNKHPQKKGNLQKEVMKDVVAEEQTLRDAGKRRFNLKREKAMRKKQEDPIMPKINLEDK